MPQAPGGAEDEIQTEQETVVETNGGRLQVTRGAGTGTERPYATATVVELGGSLALNHTSNSTDFRISPFLGYFIADRFQLTLFLQLQVLKVNDTAVRFATILEPSYHLPIDDDNRFFAFGGLGLGLVYLNGGPGVDFSIRPRVGLDVMIGRSGIFKPAAFLDLGVTEGVVAGGLEAGFSVMW